MQSMGNGHWFTPTQMHLITVDTDQAYVLLALHITDACTSHELRVVLARVGLCIELCIHGLSALSHSASCALLAIGVKAGIPSTLTIPPPRYALDMNCGLRLHF